MPGLQPGQGQPLLPVFISPTALTVTLWTACGVCHAKPSTDMCHAELSPDTYRKLVHSCNGARADGQERASHLS